MEEETQLPVEQPPEQEPVPETGRDGPSPGVPVPGAGEVGGFRFDRRVLAAIAVTALLLAGAGFFLLLAGDPGDGGGTPGPGPTARPDNAVLVAAADSRDPAASGAAYRCDGADDHVEIQRALEEAAVTGGTVLMLDGTFDCTEKLMPPMGTTLHGLGAGRTVLDIQGYYRPIELLQDQVTLREFSITGRGFILVRASRVLVENVTITTMQSGKVEANGAFFVYAKDSALREIEFRNCTAVDCGIHGFNVNGEGSPKETRDLRYIDCAAIRCGNADSNAVWTTGFDFHETNDLRGLTVLRCRAEDNWESGFHFEPGTHVTPRTESSDIRMEDCVSVENGRRNTKGYPYTDTFQSGYYVHRDAVLVNCSSADNRNAGFFVHEGSNVTFSGCTDDGSTYGWKVVKNSRDVTLRDCETKNNLEWGLWGAWTDGLVLESFVQRNVTGKDGYQSILGWYYGNDKFEKPVTNSRFVIAADGTLPAINEAGENNVYEVTRL
ncbi:MAG: hypothetical protein GXY82_07325 [Methanospirillum sp.]|nr:hypothetical protein [Methanospirillum sp.]